MALSSRPAIASLILLASVACQSGQSNAQTEPWIGRWGAPQCGTDATEIVLDRSRLDLSTFEAMCRVRRVERRGNSYRFDTNCTGEGSPLRARFTVRVDGDTLLFTEQRGLAFDPKRFVRCKGPVSQRDAATAAPRPQPANDASEILPLKHGFFVAIDTPCAQASNATLNLVRRNAISTARTLCEFSNIEKTGPTRYRVTEHCADIPRPPEEKPAAEIVTYDIADDETFVVRRSGGSEYRARYCLQSLLPQPWRSNDIRDLIR